MSLSAYGRLSRQGGSIVCSVILRRIASTVTSVEWSSGVAQSSESSKARTAVPFCTMTVTLHGSSEHSVSWPHPVGDSQSHGCTSTPDVQSIGIVNAQKADNNVMVRPMTIPSLIRRLPPVNTHWSPARNAALECLFIGKVCRRLQQSGAGAAIRKRIPIPGIPYRPAD